MIHLNAPSLYLNISVCLCEWRLVCLYTNCIKFLRKMSYSWRSPHCVNSEVPSPSLLHSILTQFNSIDNVMPHFSEIHSVTGLPSTTRASEWSSLQIFFQKFFMYFSNLPCLQQASPFAPPPAHWFHFRRDILWRALKYESPRRVWNFGHFPPP
jgi:hypothetical protein